MKSGQPQQLFRHGSVYAATSLATAGLAFMMLPVYARLLGKEGLGQVEILMVGGTALAFVVGQGLTGAWFRQRISLQGETRRAFESGVLYYLITVSTVAVGFVALVGPPLADRFTPSLPFYPLWLGTAVAACTAVFGDVYAAGLQAEQRSLAYAAFTLVRRVAIIAAILVFIAVLDWGVTGKVAGETAAAVLIAAGVLVLVRPPPPTAASIPLLRSALAYGLPLLPHGLAMQIVGMSDRFVLGHFLGVGAVGVYSLGYRVATVLEAVNGALGNAYRAIFLNTASALEHVTAAEREQGAAKLARTEVLLLTASSVLAQALALATRELLLLVGIDLREFAEATSVTSIVCWGLFAHAVYCVFAAPIVYAQKITGRLPWVSALAAIVNVLACIVFVPQFGLLAAAWATAAAHFALACGAWFAGREAFPVPRPFRRWAALFALTSVVIGAGWQLDRQVADPGVRVAAKLAILVVSALATMRASNTTLRGLANAARFGRA